MSVLRRREPLQANGWPSGWPISFARGAVTSLTSMTQPLFAPATNAWNSIVLSLLTVHYASVTRKLNGRAEESSATSLKRKVPAGPPKRQRAVSLYGFEGVPG